MSGGKRNNVKLRFGRRVRQLRVARGLSQEELALRSELDRSYIGQVERGERNVSLVNIERIAIGLGVPPADLLRGSAL